MRKHLLLGALLPLALPVWPVDAVAPEGAAPSAPAASTTALPPLAPALPVGLAARASTPTNRPAPSPSGPSWSELGASERHILAPLAPDWTHMSSSHRQKWREIALRVAQWPAADQAKLQERMQGWARLSPNDRAQARQNLQTARWWSASDRSALWEAYQALPPEKRAALQAQAAAQRASAATKTNARKTTPPATTNKTNVVPLPPAPFTRPSAGAAWVVASPGVSTVPVNQKPQTPWHQQVGMGKILVGPPFVDPVTLLPRAGLQGAVGPDGEP